MAARVPLRSTSSRPTSVSIGMVIAKFWLHVSKEEQLRRFKSRERDPFRSYKLTEEDWRNRARWSEYEAAVEEMLAHTSTRMRRGPSSRPTTSTTRASRS